MKNHLYRTLLYTALFSLTVLTSCGKPTGEKQDSTQTQSETDTSDKTDQEDATDKADDISSDSAMFQISNLADEETYDMLKNYLLQSGVSEERVQVLFDHVDQFGDIVGKDKLLAGFTDMDALSLAFDEYELQDLWYEKEADFTGYNCRITAYTIMGDRITIGDAADPDSRNTYLDLDSLAADDSALFGESSEKFEALYTTVEGADSDDQELQVKLVEEELSRRQVSFENAGNLSLVEVYLHTRYDETDNELFVGHVGVLMDMGDEGLFFIEKLAFQAPYRFIKLSSREELKAYLLKHYASYQGEGEAAPFILENGKLM